MCHHENLQDKAVKLKIMGMFWEYFGNNFLHPVLLNQPSFPDRDVQIAFEQSLSWQMSAESFY